MTNMTFQDTPHPRIRHLLGFLESLSGLPVSVDFISFTEVKEGKLKNYDVAINCGNADTSFSGAECWKDEALVVAVREYVANGGGFIGIGEPSAVYHGGRYFQLSDVLGVEKEMGKTTMFNRYNNKPDKNHFITEELTDAFTCYGSEDHVYAFEGTKLLDGVRSSMGNCFVKLSANEYYNGRSVYMAGFTYTSQNNRLFYRTLLWCAHKETELKKCYSSNVNVECNYYSAAKKYALVNNISENQKTVFYDKNGNQKEVEVLENQILWISEC